MLKIPLLDYLRDKEKYKDLDNSCIWVSLTTNTSISFNIIYLPDTFYKEGEIEYVIPKYYKDPDMYLDKFREFDPIPENFVVEINDIKARLIFKNDDLSNNIVAPSKEYINLDEYVVSEKMHWFNIAVLSFLKHIHSRRVVLSSDIAKTKRILKHNVCRLDGTPIEYKTILKLFDTVGVSDSSFKNFIYRKGEKQNG